MHIKFGNKVFIRNAGKDEYWLQDLIYENPHILGLGNLQAVNKEKKQSSGGRLDILLKDPEDNTMYEVEVMLGETDPSHIIRSIEYWDNEKRKYPQRQHFSVLIAESFDRRYFNIVQIISLHIPMIAIQADLLEADGEYIMTFTKMLDVYVEPEEDEAVTMVNESSWSDKSKWTLDSVKEFSRTITENSTLNFTQSYISIVTHGRNAYNFYKRTKPTSILLFTVKDDEKVELIKKRFDEKSIVYNYNRYKDFVLNIDAEMIKTYADVFREIHDIRFKSAVSDE
jgi:hypothetical protein